ncbi:fused MFS/spermidine synthase [Emcibacter sp. SYSU 3D8]|uniref:fused MFS/spermidine synthase n=1 Tax=Emcibacter sp. SYSU 3D8 TaxID=3133969 RepID=UPI0031FE4ADC
MKTDRTPGLLISVVYTSAIFLSAVLIFWLEPMLPKAILPLMGGTPATWVTALMFYQAILLLGYTYCYVLTRWAPYRVQAAVHVALLALAAVALPPGLPGMEAGTASPVLQVLFMLTVGAGLPLLALSATAPLAQHWFSRTGHRNAHDPYFLYAASNVGGLGALLAYPVLIEPHIGLIEQARLWTIGCAVFAVVIGGCIVLGRPVKPAAPAAGATDIAAAPPARRAGQRWMWLLLAAVPSSLLSGTTTRITTDIAAGPLFWVVPLALYLLTFVLAFARWRILPMRLVLMLQPVALAPLIIVMFGGEQLIRAWDMVAATVVLLFLSAYICHARLADSRPGPERSSEFYLMIALGGLLGGAFNAVVAPNLFIGVTEYPLALVLAVALRPMQSPGRIRWGLDVAIPVAAGAIAIAVLLQTPPDHVRMVTGIIGLVFAVGLVALAGNPVRFAIGLAAAFLLSTAPRLAEPPLDQQRNFFGVVKVLYDAPHDMTLMVNGSTSHGGQLRAPDKRRVLTSYYGARGPYGDVIAVRTAQGRARDIAAIGLGTGTIACSGPPEARWTFFEINPVVVEMARNPQFFSFLADCQPDARVLTGDGRLLLARENQRFDLIVLDAFSSDAIPMHLLTLEAFEIYFSKLKPDGMVVINISNKFVNLNPVLAALAERLGFTVLGRFDEVTDRIIHSSRWAVMARDPATLAPVLARPGWQVLTPDRDLLWTDDKSGLFELLSVQPDLNK